MKKIITVVSLIALSGASFAGNLERTEISLRAGFEGAQGASVVAVPPVQGVASSILAAQPQTQDRKDPFDRSGVARIETRAYHYEGFAYGFMRAITIGSAYIWFLFPITVPIGLLMGLASWSSGSEGYIELETTVRCRTISGSEWEKMK